MEKGNAAGVTVVVEDTPNGRVTIEASSRDTVGLSISHDAIVIVHRMFLTTPSLHPPLHAYRLSNGYAPLWTDACVRISRHFFGGGIGRAAGRLSDWLVR